MNYKYTKEKFVDSLIQYIKNILLLSSWIAILLILILFFFDSALFVNTFHFSYATLKDFYFNSLDFTMVDILAIVALLPIVITLFFFLIPYIIVEIVLDGIKILTTRCQIKLNGDDSDIPFVMILYIFYFAIGFLTFFILEKTSVKYDFFIFIFIYFIILSMSLLFSLLSFPRLLKKCENLKMFSFLLLCIEFLLFLINPNNIIILLIISTVIPYFMYLSLLLRTINKRKFSIKWILIIVFFVLYAFLLLGNNINNKQWNVKSIHNTKLNKLDEGSFNLFLNKIYLVPNNQAIDINISNKYFQNKNICFDNKKYILSFDKNNTNIKVLSLSESSKLYFTDCNNSTINVYAVKIINNHGKNTYHLLDIGYIQ